MKLSVIICTFNPRREFLTRTLTALRAQTLPAAHWELIVVDNNSSPPLSSWVDLRIFPDARIVTESAQGFTPALIRGVREANGEACVLVHDDNLLSPDYLQIVERLFREQPKLGCLGGGYIPEYEEAPAPSLTPFLLYLAVNPISADRISTIPGDYSAAPCGAGMSVRTEILRHWIGLLERDARRRALGRHTDKLTSCEDFDIAFTAVDLGYAMGLFTSLNVTHLIPRARVQPDYLRRLVEGHAYSTVMLHSVRGMPVPRRRGFIARLRHRRYLNSLSATDRAVREALDRGEARALEALDQRT